MNYVFILSTLGSSRCEQLARLFESIRIQTVPQDEIAVIHCMQGRDTNYFEIGLSYFEASVKYIPICDLEYGLSRGRNLALEALRSSNIDTDETILFFCDDDCFYPADFLATFTLIKDKQKNTGLAGIVMDESDSYALSYASHVGTHYISEPLIFRDISSINFGVPYSTDDFDENFGIGAKFPSCEEFDYIRRRIKKGLKMKYDSTLRVFHPDIYYKDLSSYLLKVFVNSQGHGAYFKKYLNIFSIYFVFLQPILSVAKHLIKLDLKNSLASFFGWFGRIYGFIIFYGKQTRDDS